VEFFSWCCQGCAGSPRTVQGVGGWWSEAAYDAAGGACDDYRTVSVDQVQVELPVDLLGYVVCVVYADNAYGKFGFRGIFRRNFRNLRGCRRNRRRKRFRGAGCRTGAIAAHGTLGGRGT
jgi:hypothetical protein